MNHVGIAGGVPARQRPAGEPGITKSNHCGLGFGSLRQLLRAGELLRQSGYDVLVAPRRVQGCGVLLLVEQRLAAPALAELAGYDIVPAEVLPYED